MQLHPAESLHISTLQQHHFGSAALMFLQVLPVFQSELNCFWFPPLLVSSFYVETWSRRFTTKPPRISRLRSGAKKYMKSHGSVTFAKPDRRLKVSTYLHCADGWWLVDGTEGQVFLEAYTMQICTTIDSSFFASQQCPDTIEEKKKLINKS